MRKISILLLILAVFSAQAQDGLVNLEDAPAYDLKSAFVNPDAVVNLVITNSGYNPPTRLPEDMEKLSNVRVVSIVNFPGFDFRQAFAELAQLPKLEMLI
ncbi:MAG: hypothetical protein HC880_15375 [Bacteroidia bacterium]|nr:hypothetical protein [Bacteroidia bacterium]